MCSPPSRAAVPGPGDVDRVQIELFDQAVHVDIDEVQPGRRAPVAQQSRLDVLELERLAQQRILVEIDLADRKVIGGAPVGIDLAEFFRGERLL